MSIGIKLLLLGLALAVAAAAGYAAVTQYNEAIARAQRLEGERDQAKTAAEGWKAAAAFWQAEKDRADQAIAGRDRRIAIANREKEALHAQIDELGRTSPEVRGWLDTPLPAAILEQLRSVATAPGGTRDTPRQDPRDLVRDDRSAALARHD